MIHRTMFTGLFLAGSALIAHITATQASSGNPPLNQQFPSLSSTLAAEPVDMLLCLAADVSESVTSGEKQLQKQGHASAISDPRVVDIIQGGLRGKVAALYVEWADQDQQFVGADWHIIEDH